MCIRDSSDAAIEKGQPPLFGMKIFALAENIEGTRKMFEDAGFVNIQNWYEFIPFGIRSTADLDKYMGPPWIAATDEAVKSDIMAFVKDRLGKIIYEEHRPIGLESALFVGQKPAA
eukprot:TRINITY_DN9712_c0_g2_i3.p1 TRINITY_DN9712_c0_g2~~TRINITY_DN9712_c0_g2_i3.p1  ORF type:complete len:135 (-),score=40.09 TRINITY_DN9712_c0_g2_i3:119-466(-)